MNPKSPWLVRGHAPAHRLRLYCFPFAGGNASSFAAWQAGLEPMIEMCAVQLPGRTTRMQEPPVTSMPDLIASLAEVIAQQDSQPFAFFGHSMGALIAFELARYCMQHGLRMPVHLFASGCAAPQKRGERRNLHLMPTDELIATLRDYNGTPPELFDHKGLMDLLLPTIRADFCMVENYAYQATAPMSIPISVLAGTQDERVTSEQAQAWGKETTGHFQVKWFDGDHFFIHPQRDRVLQLIVAQLDQVQSL